MNFDPAEYFIFNINAGVDPFIKALMKFYIHRHQVLHHQLEMALFVMSHTNSWDHVDLEQFFNLVSEIREIEILQMWMGDLISELHSNLQPDRWLAMTRNIIWRARGNNYCGEMPEGLLPPTTQFQ